MASCEPVPTGSNDAPLLLRSTGSVVPNALLPVVHDARELAFPAIEPARRPPVLEGSERSTAISSLRSPRARDAARGVEGRTPMRHGAFRAGRVPPPRSAPAPVPTCSIRSQSILIVSRRSLETLRHGPGAPPLRPRRPERRARREKMRLLRSLASRYRSVRASVHPADDVLDRMDDVRRLGYPHGVRGFASRPRDRFAFVASS